MKRRTLYLTGLALLALVAHSCTRRSDVARLPENTESTMDRMVRTAPVQVHMDTDRIHATGTAAASSTTKIMPLVGGVITKMPFKEGDVVKKGQVLAGVDQRNYKLRLRQAQAAMEGAQVALSATTREKNRFERLLLQDATARAQYDQVLDKFRGAQAQMKQARVALDMAHKAMKDTTLRAPYTGVVIKKVASIGDMATTMPPSIILIMSQISTLELKISLPEPELQRVAVGSKVQVTFPSLERTIHATITRIMRNVDPMTRSFQAIVEIPNRDMSLKPGLFAQVKIDAAKPRRRLLIPTAAVLDDGSGIHAVFVIESGVARRKEVKVVAAENDQTEIVSGLDGTEQIILDPGGLLDGDTIRTKTATHDAHSPRAEAPR